MFSTESKFYIKHQEHYKLYVDLKDKIIFESELLKNDIDYYSDLDEQRAVNGSVRYFLLDSDQSIIDSILTKNKIIASTGNVNPLNYEENKKIYKLILLIIIVMVFISLFAIITVNLFE